MKTQSSLVGLPVSYHRYIGDFTKSEYRFEEASPAVVRRVREDNGKNFLRVDILAFYGNGANKLVENVMIVPDGCHEPTADHCRYVVIPSPQIWHYKAPNADDKAALQKATMNDRHAILMSSGDHIKAMMKKTCLCLYCGMGEYANRGGMGSVNGVPAHMDCMEKANRQIGVDPAQEGGDKTAIGMAFTESPCQACNYLGCSELHCPMCGVAYPDGTERIRRSDEISQARREAYEKSKLLVVNDDPAGVDPSEGDALVSFFKGS